jgi:glutathione synthase/RimK-type ligase-like ATP-grasp enzyme
MGLSLCGVDLACADIESAHAGYSILEINDALGLANYAAESEKQYARIRRLYKKIFESNNRPFA